MNRLGAEIAVAQFHRAKREREKWSKEEDKWESKVDKFVAREADRLISKSDGEHIITAQHWDKPRPSWEMRTWSTQSTVKKITFVCSCGEEIGTVSPSGGLQKIEQSQTRHMKSVVRKSLGA